MHRKASRLGIALALLVPMASVALAQQPPFGLSWGGDANGELGDGPPNADQSSPVGVHNAANGCCLDSMVNIQGGDTSSLALDSQQRIWTWGSNFAGQLGAGATPPSSALPVQVPGTLGTLPTIPSQETIALEGAHALILRNDGVVVGWGSNEHGQLGIGPPGAPNCGTAPSMFPCQTSPVAVSLNGAFAVGAGRDFSLAIVGGCAGGPADAYAWGANGAGQLGDASKNDRFTPVQVHGVFDNGFLGGVAKMVGGEAHTIALMCNGEVVSWGNNGSGQLGHGNTDESLTPEPVVTECPPGVPPPRPLLGCPLLNVVDIAAGYHHSIAVDWTGDVYFWGDNSSGQLCDGTMSDRHFATKVLSGGLTTAATGLTRDVVAGGSIFSLVLLNDSTIVSCGANPRGNLGDCSNAPSTTPVSVLEGPSCTTPVPFLLLVEAGEIHSLAIGDQVPATPTATVTGSATVTPTPSPSISSIPSQTPTPTCGEAASFNISTGQFGGPGSPDPLWSLVSVPGGTLGSFPGPATIINPNPAWSPLPNSQWISANTGCSNTITNDCPGGIYSYELCWEQCGELDPQSLQILADNDAQVLLDGLPFASVPGFTTPATIPGFALGTGTHSLRVDVHNNPFSGGGGTATGMILSGSLTGSVKFVECEIPPSPTPTPTSTPTLTLSPSPTATRTPSLSPTPTVTPTPTCGEPLSIDISTGQGGSFGSPDPLWSLISVPPATTGSFPGPATIVFPNGAWSSLPNSQWISANSACGNTLTNDCPGGIYSYALCWEQCGRLDPQSLQILADNDAQVLLDGLPIASVPGFTTPTTIPAFSLGPGTHTLRVDVNNIPFAGSGTATGMILSGSLNGSVTFVECEIPPSPTPTASATPTNTPTSTPTQTPTRTCGLEPISINVSTGPIGSPGNPDPIWTLISAPAGTTNFSPGPATIISPNGAWTTLPSTQWISANTSCDQTTTFDCPGGTYSYQFCWEQCGPLVPESLQILADNNADVYVDSGFVGHVPGFNTPTTIPGFSLGTGKHALRIDVHNSAFSGGGGTATGLDVSGTLNGSVAIVPCRRRTFPGDANCNERLDPEDPGAAATAIFDPVARAFCDANCNDDDKVTAADLTCVVQRVASGQP